MELENRLLDIPMDDSINTESSPKKDTTVDFISSYPTILLLISL